MQIYYWIQIPFFESSNFCLSLKNGFLNSIPYVYIILEDFNRMINSCNITKSEILLKNKKYRISIKFLILQTLIQNKRNYFSVFLLTFQLSKFKDTYANWATIYGFMHKRVLVTKKKLFLFILKIDIQGVRDFFDTLYVASIHEFCKDNFS